MTIAAETRVNTAQIRQTTSPRHMVGWYKEWTDTSEPESAQTKPRFEEKEPRVQNTSGRIEGRIWTPAPAGSRGRERRSPTRRGWRSSADAPDRSAACLKPQRGRK